MLRMQNLDATFTFIPASAVASITQAGTNSTIKLTSADSFALVEAADIVATRVVIAAQSVASGFPTPAASMPVLTRRA